MRRIRAHFRVFRLPTASDGSGHATPAPPANSAPNHAPSTPADPCAGAPLVGVNPGVGDGGSGGGTGGRLNLLLSWGGWRTDSWADSLGTLLEPMGVHSIRARTARQAEQVIRTQPVHIAVVDLGLPLDIPSPPAAATTAAPEEAGARILELLRRLETPPPTVVVRSPRPTRDATRDLSAALRCDAFAVVDRGNADLELMLKVLQRALQRFYQGRWPQGRPGLHPDTGPSHLPRPT